MEIKRKNYFSSSVKERGGKTRRDFPSSPSNEENKRSTRTGYKSQHSLMCLCSINETEIKRTKRDSHSRIKKLKNSIQHTGIDVSFCNKNENNSINIRKKKDSGGEGEYFNKIPNTTAIIKQQYHSFCQKQKREFKNKIEMLIFLLL